MGTETEAKKSEPKPLEAFVEVPLGAIAEWMTGQRAVDEEHVEALARSMKEIGQRAPILVVDRQDGTYRGLDGDHRYEAAKRLKWTHIRAEVLPPSENEADLLRVRFAANKFRLELDPIQEAEEARGVFEAERRRDPKVKQGDVARSLGFDEGTFSQLLDLPDLPPPVKEFIRSGKLAKSHAPWIHAALAKPAKGVPAEAWAQKVLNLATDAANRGTDVRTAIATVEATRARLQTEAEQAERFKKDAATREAKDKRHNELVAAFDKARKTAKARTCPGPATDWEPGDAPDAKCSLSPAFFDEVLAEKGRFVAFCPEGEERLRNPGHGWDLATGKLQLNPSDRKAVDKILKDRARQTAEFDEETKREARAEKETAKESKVLEKKAKPADRDYAAIYVRTPDDRLLQILADAAKPALREVEIDEGDTMTVRVDKERFGIPDLVVTPVEMPDGKGGAFHARIRIGHYGSGNPAWAGPGNYSGRGDDVAEGAGALHLRKVRAALLRVIAKAGGAKQREDDLWPVAVQGFRLGETVAVGPKYEVKGYRGTKGRILAFDPEWEAFKHGGYYDERGTTIRLRPDRMHAVLDIAKPTKAFPLSQLVHVATGREGGPRIPCAICARKVRLAKGAEKSGRYCEGCAKAEAKCTCTPLAKKEKGPPKKKAKAKAAAK